MVPRLARELTETRRYHAIVSQRITRGQIREVLGPTYGRRFLFLAVIALLTNVFNAPSSQLTNRYLQDVRHFSGSGIVVLLAVTTVVPGILGVVVASRLAERGRRIPLASVSLFFATGVQMVFFLVGGPTLWVSSGLATLTGAVAGIVLATLGAELFATEVRGTAERVPRRHQRRRLRGRARRRRAAVGPRRWYRPRDRHLWRRVVTGRLRRARAPRVVRACARRPQPVDHGAGGGADRGDCARGG